MKEFAFELTEPVCHIFNVCLQEGIFPNAWKCSSVTPISKVTNAKTLRPISLTEFFVKSLRNSWPIGHWKIFLRMLTKCMPKLALGYCNNSLQPTTQRYAWVKVTRNDRADIAVRKRHQRLNGISDFLPTHPWISKIVYKTTLSGVYCQAFSQHTHL